METVAQLDKNFPRIQVVRASKGKAVVERHPAIGDVQGLNVQREALAETLPEREVKGGMRLKMIAGDARVAVGKPGGVVNVGCRVRMKRQFVSCAEVQSVALVMIEQSEAVAEVEISQAAVDVAEGESELIGIREINLRPIADARRAQRKLPAVDARALNRDREKQVGIVEIIVVEEILGASEKIAGVQRPAVEWNGNAELVLFIAFAVERNEAQVLIVGGLQKRAGNGQQRRRLVKMTIKGAENPVEPGNPQRSANARAGSILNHSAGEMCLAETSIQAEPGCGLELFFGVDGRERSIRIVALGWIHVLALRRVVAN